MSSPPLQPPPDGDANRAPLILGITFAMNLLSCIVVALRLYTRIRILRAPGLDDAVIVFAMMVSLLNMGLQWHACDLGIGRHVYYLVQDPQNLSKALYWQFIADPPGIIGIAIPKLAIVIFLHRICGTSYRKSIIALYVLVSLLLAASIASATLLFAQCDPPAQLWDKTVKGTCLDPRIDAYFGYFTGAFSGFTDIVLALFPLVFLWDLNMRLKRKIGLAIIMSFGLLAFVCSVNRTISLASLLDFNADFTWVTGITVIWNGVELNIVVICASVPTLLPLFQQLNGSHDYMAERKSSQYHSSSNKSSGPPPAPRRPPHLSTDQVDLRPLHAQGTMSGTAYHDASSHEFSGPGIKTTTEVSSGWEAV